MKRMRQAYGRGALFFFVVMFVGLSLHGCSEEKKQFKKPAVPVKTQKVKEAPARKDFKFTASLIPRKQLNLAFKVGGFVKEIVRLPGPDGKVRIAQNGDPVRKGIVLAKLRDLEYLAKLDKAKAAREEQMASYREAKANFARYDRLFKLKAVAKSEYDEAKEKLDVFKAAVSQEENEIKEAKIQLKDTVLRSPINGVIAKRMIEVGSLISPGMPVFVIEDLSLVKALFGVTDYLVRDIKPGETMSVRIEALGDREFSGIITAVAPSADRKSRLFDVEVSIKNPDRVLKDGMIAAVKVAAKVKGISQLNIPIHSIVRDPDDPDGFMVYVVKNLDGRLVAQGRKVKIGGVSGNRVSIVEGLTMGDEILSTGANIVTEGDELTIIH